MKCLVAVVALTLSLGARASDARPVLPGSSAPSLAGEAPGQAPPSPADQARLAPGFPPKATQASPPVEDADVDSYLTGVQQKIWALWNKQIKPGFEHPVEVTFTILADGSVTDLLVAESSGAARVDMGAERAILDAAPFGLFPQGSAADRKTITAVFRPDGEPSGPQLSAVGRPGTPVLTGAVTDRTGDASPHPGVAVSPDLLAATIEVTAGGLMLLRARCAPGTFDPDTTSIQFAFDVDQDPMTGDPIAGLGIDYVIDLESRLPGRRASVSRNVARGTYRQVARLPVAVRPDGMDVHVPLSVLGGDDGRLSFRVVTTSRLGGDSSSGVLDTMPDPELPGGVVAPPNAAEAPVRGDDGMSAPDASPGESAEAAAPPGPVPARRAARQSPTGLRFDPHGADFTVWVGNFRTEVHRNWTLPRTGSVYTGHVDFEFTIERDGRMSSLRMLNSSGTVSLDEAARNALQNSRMMALPDDYGPQRVTMQVTFFYNEAPGQGR
jgi:TonB family protein